MNTQNQNGYMLLYRTDEWYNRLSHEELQKLIGQNQAWFERLTAQGKAKPGRALERTGVNRFWQKRTIRYRTGRLLNRRKPLVDIWCSTSKRSKKPLPLRRAARAWLMAVQSKCARWLKNVPSTSARVNWREKNSL